VLRHTQGGGGPGGWGEAIGELRAHVSPHLITLRVPLQWIAADGMLGYGLELYATVAGGPSGNDPVAEYGRCYTGTTRRHGHGSPLVAVSDGRSDGGTLLR
jgi:hypothetical protein